MKKLLVLLALSLPFVSFNSFSQTWAPVGAAWYYGFSVFTTNGYYKISYIGDTVINTIPCKILEKKIYQYDALAGFDTITLNHEYTYADINKVYIYRFNNFYTLYDFSAIIGDTIIIAGTNKYSSSGCDSVGAIKIDSIGTMSINSETLRYISVSPTATSKWGWACRIVEKIGPIYNYQKNSEPYNYLFPEKLDYCGMNMDEFHEGGFLRCYSEQQNSFAYNQLGSTHGCDSIYTGINELTNIFSEIKIAPNPTSNILRIAFNLNSKQTVQIEFYDIMGELIFSENVTETNGYSKTYNLTNLASGIYFIKLKSNRNTIVKKISKY